MKISGDSTGAMFIYGVRQTNPPILACLISSALIMFVFRHLFRTSCLSSVEKDLIRVISLLEGAGGGGGVIGDFVFNCHPQDCD